MWYVIKQEFGYRPVKASAGFPEKTIAEEVRQKLERIAKNCNLPHNYYLLEHPNEVTNKEQYALLSKIIEVSQTACYITISLNVDNDELSKMCQELGATKIDNDNYKLIFNNGIEMVLSKYKEEDDDEGFI